MQAKGLLVLMLTIGIAEAASIRDHTRPQYSHTTTINETQAAELTLTVVRTGKQHLQTWLRLAAVIDISGRHLSASSCSPDARWLAPGQRVRAFTPDIKSSIYQARVSKIVQQKNCITVTARLSAKSQTQNKHYVMEIIVPRGQFIAIPKEAILEEGEQRIVYVQKHPGHYVPRQIHGGLEGELYTEIRHGLKEGDRVVTFGSFFIDAEHKLKATSLSETSHAHHNH